MEDRNAGADYCHVIFNNTPLYDDHAVIYNMSQLLDYEKLEGSCWRLAETYMLGLGQWKPSEMMLANN